MASTFIKLLLYSLNRASDVLYFGARANTWDCISYAPRKTVLKSRFVSCGLSAILSSTLPVLAKENKNSSKRLNFELMEPVKLKNPLSLNWGLEAGGPKHTVYKKVSTVVVKEDVVVDPVIVTPVTVEEKTVVITAFIRSCRDFSDRRRICCFCGR